MASLIQDYAYDIFISYRQKDNKGDRWVSEFVEALKTELESTFKEDVSVYFDINPHDGLLETHDVNASLSEKLKCLVFIPIISRTYCDPKSYAWENEFKVFVEQASGDKFGLKINLPRGNVASRVLPVRIHDLDITDIKLCESLLGGVLRGVDFVYKSSGVNRPLRVNEDHPQDNLNKTYYRDQVNKVANAIDEIFHSLKSAESVMENAENKAEETLSASPKKNKKDKSGPLLGIMSKRTAILLFSFFLCVSGAFLIYFFLNREKTVKSVAILPFRTMGNDPELISYGDIITEIVLTKLHKVKSLIKRSSISTSQYRDKNKPINTIRKELDVVYLVDGSIRREGEKIVIWVGLTDAKNNKQLWSDEFVCDSSKISGIVSEITRNIIWGCNIDISQNEEKEIDSEPTINSDAYLKYISANVVSNDAWNILSTGEAVMESDGFIKAVKDYDKAIKIDSMFAEAYARRAISRSWGYYTRQFDSTCFKECRKDISKAMDINKDLTEAQIALGFYYYYCDIDYQKALVHFNRASEKDQENYQPLFYMAMVYRRMGDWGKSQNLISKVIKQNPQVALFLTNIGLSYTYLHKLDSALIYHQKAIDISPEWSAPYLNKIDVLILKDGNLLRAKDALESASKNTGKRLQDLRILFDIYEGKLKNALFETDHSIPGDFRFQFEKYLIYAKIYGLLNNSKIAAIYYDSALVNLDTFSKIGNSSRIHSLKALANAGKGNKEKALEESKLSVELTLRDITEANEMKLLQAQVYTMLGDYDNAIINIEYLLDNPSIFSVKLLQIDPVWKPLLNIPEVKTLINKHI